MTDENKYDNTPEQHAKELIERFQYILWRNGANAGSLLKLTKACTNFNCDEMINAYKKESVKEFDLIKQFQKIDYHFGNRYGEVAGSIKIDYFNSLITHWQAIKTIINE